MQTCVFLLGGVNANKIPSQTHTDKNERRPVRSDPHWLKLSTVSRSGRVRLTGSLAASAATDNRCLALPFSPAAGIDWM